MVFSKYFEKLSEGHSLGEETINATSRDSASQTTNTKKTKARSFRADKPPVSDSKPDFVSKSGKATATERVKPESSKREGRKRRRNDQASRPSPKAQKRAGPSAEALELSQRLKELSRRKKLSQAIKLFWDTDKNIRDAHHACIVVDCCARCGDVSKAESILGGISSDMSSSIELQTALIKGFSHAGDMGKAMQRYRSLFPTTPRRDRPLLNGRPNVRTLNTLLRGALWTASMSSLDDGGGESRKSTIAGGIVSSEEAWTMYQKHCSEQSPPDSSSYEATVSILCQSLRVEEAQARIEEFQQQNSIRIKGKASIKVENPDQSVFETFASIYLSLSRAHALLGNWDGVWSACQRSLHGIEASRSLLTGKDTTHDDVQGSTGKNRKRTWSGGKRGKKDLDPTEGDSESRMVSNLKYREHRLKEMELEAKALLKIRKDRTAQSSFSLDDLHSRINTKLFYFGGGGTTDLSANESDKSASSPRQPSVLPNWISFGLCEVHRRLKENVDRGTPPSSVEKSFKDCFDSSQRLKPSIIFGNDASNPLDVELGAGFGDWIVRQADHHRKRNYIAVELRADRVHQIFAKGTLKCKEPLGNLCVVGAEAGSFLRSRLRKGTVSTFFVNFPEPPTQTYGDDRFDLDKVESGEDEPAHMLCFANLKTVFARLRRGGQAIIVTDNKWYARLLCVTLVRLSLQDKSMRPLDTTLLSKHGFQVVESFRNNIKMFEGQPNEIIGHVVEQTSSCAGSSYFDRLWRTGASNYAQKTSRFIIGFRKPA